MFKFLVLIAFCLIAVAYVAALENEADLETAEQFYGGRGGYGRGGFGGYGGYGRGGFGGYGGYGRGGFGGYGGYGGHHHHHGGYGRGGYYG